MYAVVTGAAGFIGSHLCADLLASGDDVLGIDAFTDHYDPARKEDNLSGLLDRPNFRLLRRDLLSTPLRELFAGADVIYHLAGRPGVRARPRDFPRYLADNVNATHKLLQAAMEGGAGKVVYASSSSVYGDTRGSPATETMRPRPMSPYGVTKLAAEHLCELYRTAHALPTVSLRLFTVYGLRQRPDMAFARLTAAALHGGCFPLYGDGDQTREFTHVSDVVTAMRAAAASAFTGVANIGGGARASINEAIEIVERLTGPVDIRPFPACGDEARHTHADISRAATAFGYRPSIALPEGLAAMMGHGR
ncbi:NAD-dependent epimerase/dehydratase family protein [Nonomuraea sp. NPDC050404]|uniref:NAD-dependent epimerase/dehydratase family protein n=1 Tax=Nonomuraea sp. NPDC050404 TaxID=3155783 RepID=UPI0033F4E894